MTDQQLAEMLKLLNLIHNKVDEVLALLIQVSEKIAGDNDG